MATASFVALIRGVNVGGKAKLPMADLRALLTQLGFAEARTLLQSGNVVLRTDASSRPGDLERALREAIGERFDLAVSCLVRTEAEFRDVVSANPLAEFADLDGPAGSKMQVIFLSAEPEPALLAAHDPVGLDPKRIVLGDRAIYQWCPDGILTAPAVGSFVERNLKVATTARNWNTLRKLLAALA